MDTVLFWILAIVAVVTSIMVVGQRHPMRSVLLLIGSFCALSGLYVLLGSPFVAVIQIIIYAGAIMVLFLFVVMLLNVPTEDALPGRTILSGAGPRRFGAVLAIVLAIELAWALRDLHSKALTPGQESVTVHQIGMKLFTEYAFAFEATSVLILVAMVGAIVLAQREHQ